ncbi:MAG: type II toxin-antitoxin system VapC family toxin [Chloroflexales bacterium]|nr:type II toxin-antitoxin system VapC family toxin [Chloroflexales bacterium]
MKLDTAMAGVARLGIDTAPFIYFLERNPVYVDRVHDIFKRIAQGSMVGISSVVTLVEVLVQPKQFGNTILVQQYQRLLLHSRHFSLRAIDAASVEQAADLRARYGIRTPDALQIATALNNGCTAFLTNDDRLKRVSDLIVLVLEDLAL